jgi:hypothetical protein
MGGGLAEPGEDFAEQRQGVVGDDNGDDERHRRVEPVPASGGQDDRLRRGQEEQSGDGCSAGAFDPGRDLDPYRRR